MFFQSNHKKDTVKYAYRYGRWASKRKSWASTSTSAAAPSSRRTSWWRQRTVWKEQTLRHPRDCWWAEHMVDLLQEMSLSVVYAIKFTKTVNGNISIICDPNSTGGCRGARSEARWRWRAGTPHRIHNWASILWSVSWEMCKIAYNSKVSGM